MPVYEFRNKKTGEISEASMKMAEKEQYLKDNPDLEPAFITPPHAGDPFALGVKKIDGGWKERLKQIKACNPGSTINVD